MTKLYVVFWDNVAGVYDIFENIINKKTNKGLCVRVEEEISEKDEVLECACGTGLLSGVIAKRCKSLVATDFSVKMLMKASKKLDVVVAANVIHLLDEPYKALAELDRVCRKGGKIILPTYMNKNDKGKTSGFVNAIGKAGADFKRQFTFDTYKRFIKDAGYENVKYTLIEGKIPCAVAVITLAE